MSRVNNIHPSMKLAFLSASALLVLSGIVACSSDDTSQQPSPATWSTSATEPPAGDQEGNGSGSGGGSGTSSTSTTSDAGKGDAPYFPGKSDKPM